MSEIGERNFEKGMVDSYGERRYQETLRQRREIPWGQIQPGYPEYAPPQRDYITGRPVK